MAYNRFAAYYDQLNCAADYDSLAGVLVRLLRTHGVPGGLAADLGCGTGEVCLRLARAGYDMIAVDASAQMLSVFNEKLRGKKARQRVLLLNQNLCELDLFGTVRAAVSCFDTLNHLNPAQLRRAVAKTALFLEAGGLFIFDVNTAYKHRCVLANNTFTLGPPGGGLRCVWHNRLCAQSGEVCISIEGKRGETLLFHEEFSEYLHELDTLEQLLAENGFKLCEQMDGENFGPLNATSQRALFAAKKL